MSGTGGDGVLGFPESELPGIAARGIEDEHDFVGVPDAYQRTWVPHRMTYIDGGATRSQRACAFCEAPRRPDVDSLIVHRGRYAYVVMNLYPYNSGHLLVCPYRHIPTYDLTTEAEMIEIGHLTRHAMRVLRADSNCAGFNIGMNQGRVAGAGIAGHLHQHIVPRWPDDANFMPIIARTKAMPELLGDLRDRLAARWDDPALADADSGTTADTDGLEQGRENP